MELSQFEYIADKLSFWAGKFKKEDSVRIGNNKG